MLYRHPFRQKSRPQTLLSSLHQHQCPSPPAAFFLAPSLLIYQPDQEEKLKLEYDGAREEGKIPH